MAVKVEFPPRSRATRFRLKSIPAGTSLTQWKFTPTFGTPFIITTTPTEGTGENVLRGRLYLVDIWLPPFHTYTLKTRHYVTNVWQAWSATQKIATRGPLNSFEKFLALSGTGVDNVDAQEE